MFALGHLAALREPHASLIEMFLRVRGNVKDMERELGLSYPTVRARLEEALEAAGFPKESQRRPGSSEETEASWEAQLAGLDERIQRRVEASLARLNLTRRSAAESRHSREREQATQDRRAQILDQLERGEIAADEAAALLRELKHGR
jgi:hypothetical protein